MRKAWIVSAVVAILVSLTACSDQDEAAPVSMCGWIVGDGENGRDANVKKVVYPGQIANMNESEEDESWWIYCNPRNYIVSDGTKKDANGKPIGDRFQPSEARTKEGTKVLVYWTSYWMVNQTESVLEDPFYKFCYKYECSSAEPVAGSGDKNNSTDGWNDMLGENFSTAGDRLVREQAPLVLTDASWQTEDPEEWEALATEMSANFADEIRPNAGTSEDLFCSSYDGAWEDPKKPGEGTFTCKPVYFTVDKIVNANEETQAAQEAATAAAQQKAINKKLLEASQEKYGTMAGFWLGMFDAIDKCDKTGVTCNVILGGGSQGPSVTLPDAPSGKK